MKTLKFSLVILLVGMLSFFQCTKEEIVSYYNVSGTVTYTDGNAAGAYVYLAEGNTPTSLYSRVAVTDANGKYSFDNLAAGDYYLYANYNSSSQAAGRLDGITFLSGEDNLITITSGNVVQDIPLLNQTGASTVVDNTANGTWKLDKSHSEAVFEFPYKDTKLAMFTGRFDTYDFIIDLDDSDLANSSIYGEVDLTTSNTGQPGRDGAYNCIAGTLGVTWTDNDGDGDPKTGPETVVAPTGVATFQSTNIEFFGDGYKATGNLVFHGVTKAVTVYFKYFPGYEGTDRSGNPVHYASFEAKFQFDALGDFGISSGSIGGIIDVYVSAQLSNPL